MKVLFILANRPKYAGTSVYAERLTKELEVRLTSGELFVMSEVEEWRRALLTTIRTSQPDLVHVLFANPADTLRVGFLLRQMHIPKILTVHQIPPKESRIKYLYGWPRTYFFVRGMRYCYSRLLLRTAVRYYSALLVPNHSTKTELEKLSSRSVYRSPEGVSFRDSSSKKPDEAIVSTCPRADNKGPIILTVAAFIFHKGIHQMLDALANVVSEYPNLRYIVAGSKRDPTYFRHLQARVRAKRLTNHVQFLPDAETDTIVALYKNCDVYVQPSYEEGFCLTFLQALAMKRGSDKSFVLAGGKAGEIPTLMELAGMSEFLFDAKSTSALEEKLRLALHAAGRGFSPQIRWQEIMETYSWENTAAKTYDVYKQAKADLDLGAVT